MAVEGEEPVALKGRIDRIDRHEDGRVAIWDYKTGDNAKTPAQAHRRGGRWVDLQLPLYVLLAGELLAEEGKPAELGYVNLGRDVGAIAFREAERWGCKKDEDPDEVLASAYLEAQRVVRDVRAGRFFELGDWRPYEPIFEALGGVGLVASIASDGDEAEEAEA